MIKDKENAEPMQPAGQGEGLTGSLFNEEIPVWYNGKGKVCPKWTSRCEEEREQTMNLLEEIASLWNLTKEPRGEREIKLADSP